MKRNFYLIAIFLTTLLCITAGKNLFSQTTQLSSAYNNAVNIELDKFLYAIPIDGVSSYEFFIEDLSSGQSQTIVKNTNYFSLNELNSIDVFYNTAYSIKARPATVSSNWGNSVRVRTVEDKSYMYGHVRIQFLQEEYFKYTSFYTENNIVQNLDITGFNNLAQAAGIREFRNVNKKFLELTGKNPYSCIDLIFDESFSVDSILNFFNTGDYVELVEPHYIYHLSAVPSEYNSSNPNFWHLRDIDAQGAWNILNGDRQNVIIAVIDNVFDIDHIDLRKNIYVNTGEIPNGTLTDTNGNGVIDADDLLTYYSTRGYSSLRQLFANPPVDAIFNGVDNDGNGYIDDICGWNAKNNNNNVTPLHTNGDPLYISHGTHVAGIAGAVSNNGGICALSNNNVRILPIQTADDNNFYSRNISNILDAVEYILNLNEKPQILSMSFGDNSPISNLDQALLILEERYDILSIASTGNRGNLNSGQFPACYSNVIAVGATTNTNTRADFSNYGNIYNTYVLAPGKDIYSAMFGITTPSLYENMSGTSMSTPLVSSLAGLLYSYNPNLSPEYARQAIICGCNNNPNQINNYNAANDGSGKINAHQTLICLKRMTPVANIEQTVDFYCPGTNYYRFNGQSLSSLENCTYNWSITGGTYNITGGTSSPNLNVKFLNTGIYTVNLRITNLNGTNTYSLQVEVKNPSVIIQNGVLTETCRGNNTNIFLEFEGNPPFRINYSFNGQQHTISNINSNNYILQLNTSSFPSGASRIFNIINFYDSNCTGNIAQTQVKIKDCMVSCSGKYNQIWHLNKFSTPSTAAISFNPTAHIVSNPFMFPSSAEGSASISDYDGNPILSVSRGNIYSTKPNCYNAIINTTSILEDDNYSSTQGNLILPDKTNPNKYYIITVSHDPDPTPDLSWGVVDFTNNECGIYIHGGRFHNNDIEKLTACSIIGANGYWILTHRKNSHTFNIYKLLFSNGIITYESNQNFPHVVQNTGSLGEMKFDLSMNYLAVADDYKGLLELYSFRREHNWNGNRLTLLGTKNFDQQCAPYSTELFSLEFSPNSKYLYFTLCNKKLYQIPVENFNSQTPIVITSNITRCEGVGLGPDMKLYVNNDYNYTGVISNPNSHASQISFIPRVFTTKHHFGFPPRVPIDYADFELETYITDCSSRIRTINAIGTPTQYTWSTGAITPEITVTEVGTYSVTVIFSNGCAVIRTIDIIQSNIYISPEFTDIQVHHPCDNQNDGYISVTVSGGRQPYTYRWTNSIGQYIGNQATLLNLRPGIYRLTVRDALGCSITTEQTIYPASTPIISVVLINNICQIGDGGSAEVTYEGSGQYQYLWSNGETTCIARNLPAGINYVTVTDLNGCFSIGSIEIREVNATPLFKASKTCLLVQDNELYFFPIEIPSSDWHLYNFTWLVNSERTYTGAEVYPMFEHDGYYCITLTVERDGCYTSHTETMYVFPYDCYCDPNNYDYESMFIDRDTEWGGETIRILNKIIVASDVTLKLKDCVLKFGPNGGIIINQRAKVISNNTVFTSFEDKSCNHMWQGIEVLGHNMLSSHSSTQGRLELLTGSEVRNAHIGVLLGKRSIHENGYNICINTPSEYYPFDGNFAGGILITAESESISAKFINNGIHIKAIRKKNPNNAEALKILNCLFTCEGQLLDIRYNYNANTAIYDYENRQNPWAGYANIKQRTTNAIEVEGLKNFNIYKCKFNNNEIGIYSIDAKYNVLNSSFYDAFCGIYILNSNTSVDNRHEITGCSFDKIYKRNHYFDPINSSIYISGSIYDYIHDNEFGSNETEQSLSSYGIYLYNSSGFNIIENNFKYLYTGVSVYNSNVNGGYIGAGLSSIHSNWTGNIFTSCKTSISTSSSNQNLKLKCNNCYNDFNQLYEVNFNSKGILANQGSMPVNNVDRRVFGAKKAAGNEFDGFASNPKKVRSLTNSYSYFHHASPYYTIPDVSTSIAPISLASVGVAKGTRASACNPQLEDIIVTPDPDVITIPDWGITAPIDWHISRIDSLAKLIEEYQLQYSKIIDNLDSGNKDYILKEIYNEKPSSQLADDLIKTSPLSDEVLIALITEYPVNHYSFFNIMQYNMPVSREVEEYLMARLETLPEKEREMILSMQAFNEYNENSHGNINNYIDALKMDRQLYLNSLISVITNLEHKYIKTKITLLEREKNISSEKTLISTYIAEGDYKTAEYALNNFEKIIKTKEDQIWYDYTGFILNIYINDRDFYSLTKSEKSFLREIAENCNAGLASANAQSILIYYYGETFKECEDMPTKAKKFVKEVDYNKFLLQAYISDNYPEPFTNETYVDYYIPQGSTGQVKIMDIFGRIVTEYNIEEGTNILKIDLSDFTNGVYTYGLIVDGKAIDYKKMVLTR